MPQEFRDLFHPNLSEYQSAQEEQSDSLSEYTIADSGDESDDIVGYDLTNGRYTTRADRDRRKRRDQHLAYRRRRRERWTWTEWKTEEAKLANIQRLLLRQRHYV